MKRPLLAMVLLLAAVRPAPSEDAPAQARRDLNRPAADAGWGVLVLAHGGEPRWNAAVRKAVAKAKLGRPTEIAFGMAAMPGEVQGIAEALGRLRRAGATRIVAVPLLVSSYSEVYRQYQYVLGLSAEPGFSELEMQLMHSRHGAGPSSPWDAAGPRSPAERGGAEASSGWGATWDGGYAAEPGAPTFDELERRYMNSMGSAGPHGEHHAMGPVSPVRMDGTPIFLTRALDDSPEVAEVLIDRARKLSRAPARETAILVAHGPVGDDDNGKWKETLLSLRERLIIAVPFAYVLPHSLRDDAPPTIREAATRDLREAVTLAKDRGRPALILPVLVSAGGIEKGLVKRLGGLPYRMGKPLLPHPAISRWISRKVSEATRSPSKSSGTETGRRP